MAEKKRQGPGDAPPHYDVRHFVNGQARKSEPTLSEFGQQESAGAPKKPPKQDIIGTRG